MICRFEEITYPIEQPVGPHLGAAVERADWLAAHDLAAAHLLVAEDVTEERHQRPGAEHPGVILLRQGAGLRRTNLLSTELAGFVSACDGDLSVGQIIGALEALLGGGRGVRRRGLPRRPPRRSGEPGPRRLPAPPDGWRPTAPLRRHGRRGLWQQVSSISFIVTGLCRLTGECEHPEERSCGPGGRKRGPPERKWKSPTRRRSGRWPMPPGWRSSPSCFPTQVSRTATELAARSGLTPSAMSYHLRALQKWGFVVPAATAGDARERRWKAAGTDFSINSRRGSGQPRIRGPRPRARCLPPPGQRPTPGPATSSAEQRRAGRGPPSRGAGQQSAVPDAGSSGPS